jgi:hypothetical protein
LRQLVFHQLIARDDVGAPVLIDVREAGDLERFLHMIEQFLLIDRLGQEPKGAAVRGMHGIGNGAVCGQNDHPQSRPTALQLLQQTDAIHMIHAQIRDDEIRPEAHAGRQGRRSALHRFNLVILGAQSDGQ